MPVKVGGINDRITRNNDIQTDEYLQVNCCGIYEKTAENTATLRPFGRKDYQLIIVSKGQAIFKYNGDDILLNSGEMIIIPPNVRNEYRYSDPIDAIWIHFSGSGVNKILQSYDMEPFVNYGISNAGHFILYAEKIIKEFQLKKVGYMNNCNGYLLNILTLAKRRIDLEIYSDNKNSTPDLTFIVDEMQTNFSDKKGIEDYAKMCNISVSRFTHLFTEKFGISPYKFLLKIRINQAKYLLTETNISISDIAKSIGYEDPFYFSRIFKKTVGVSPNLYRKSKE